MDDMLQGTCKVFIGGDLPGLFKLGHHRIRAGWLGTSVREPSVPDRFDLGAVVVGLLKVNPALTTGLLLIIFPVCVAIAVKAYHTTPLGIADILHVTPVLGKAAISDVVDGTC